jgi:CheY-like chemotaxis protein
MMRILVVDDEPDTESLFSQRFRKELRDGSVEFQFAQSAEAALDLVNGSALPAVALILSDINLPGASGVDLLTELKQRLVDTKVYMIDPCDDDGRRAAADENGADGYLSKPLDFDQLRRDVLHLP